MPRISLGAQALPLAVKVIRRSQDGIYVKMTTNLRATAFISLMLCLAKSAGSQTQQDNQNAGGSPTLTVVVEDVNTEGGSIGVLVFNSSQGWPEDRFVALRGAVAPAHPGTVTVTIPALPAGAYAVALVHDVNQNHKVDRNFFGTPKEQWGMSNNPSANMKAPSFSEARFSLTGDREIHVRMQ